MTCFAVDRYGSKEVVQEESGVLVTHFSFALYTDYRDERNGLSCREAEIQNSAALGL